MQEACQIKENRDRHGSRLLRAGIGRARDRYPLVDILSSGHTRSSKNLKNRDTRGISLRSAGYCIGDRNLFIVVALLFTPGTKSFILRVLKVYTKEASFFLMYVRLKEKKKE
jgi:hypothetical protein